MFGRILFVAARTLQVWCLGWSAIETYKDNIPIAMMYLLWVLVLEPVGKE